MKKHVIGLSLSLCLLGTAAFANECVENISSHLFNGGSQLDLSECKISDNDMQNVVEYLNKNPGIKELYIADNNLTDQGISALKDTSLTWVAASNNNIGSWGASVLAQMPFIEMLDLSDNHIGDYGAKALAKNGTIKQLFVEHDNITGEGISAIATSTSVWNLAIGGNTFDKNSLNALSNDKLIRWLWIRDSNISTNDTITLVSHMKSLTNLDISDNPIGNQGAIAIAQKPNINQLNANGCAIGNDGAMSIAKSNNLYWLELARNHIGDEGAAVLAKTKIQNIDLTDNDIADAGASAFANSKIDMLILDHNRVSDAGAIALATNSSLKTLFVRFNQIGETGLAALAKSGIENLDTDGNFSEQRKKSQLVHSFNKKNRAFRGYFHG